MDILVLQGYVATIQEARIIFENLCVMSKGPTLGQQVSKNLTPDYSSSKFEHSVQNSKKFQPTGEEFLNHYLQRRVRRIVDQPCIIPDVNISSWDPWALPDKFHEIQVVDDKKSMRLTGESIIPKDDQVQEWWFFCPHTPDRVKRSTPSGYWKKTGVDQKVKDRNTDSVIGNKKILVFHRGQGKKGIKTNWVMHEYHLPTNDVVNPSLLYSL
ncbi:hypothetical protein BT93_I0636 [Corymbia citriodora subsp. variegata]|nr:hypothetical protein BT93_I0636 [Corymbia citriodora subsp. variegata]